VRGSFRFQGDRKGRPYYTWAYQADPVYSRGDPCGRPCSLFQRGLLWFTVQSIRRSWCSVKYL